MRKFLALGALALCVLSFAVPASARSKVVSDRVIWRSSYANSQGYRDSSIVCEGVTTARADTTAPISIFDWVLPEQTITPTASDSVAWMLLHIFPQTVTGITASSDTIHIAVQVSEDATTWTWVRPPINGGDMVNHIVGGVTDTVFAGVAAAGAEDVPTTSSVHRYRWRTVTGGVTAGGWNWNAAGTFPNYLQIWGHRYIRFIIVSDFTGCFQAHVTHYVSD